MNCVFRLLTIAGIFAATAAAQLTRGFVSGTVTDPAGAIMPRVKVTLTRETTSSRHTTLTNQSGVFRFVALESGTYSVVFEKDGFTTTRLDNIELTTAQEVVLNQILPVGASATTISVEGTAPGVQLSKATPTVERTMGQQLIENLPFREVADLAILSPGTVVTGSEFTQIAYSANGQRAGANTITTDGIDNKDPQYGFVSLRSTRELAAELQVRTNSYSAEFGRGLGAQVSIVTRSGTNRWRGEAWDYYGANWMSAVTLANKYAGRPDARFSDHQAGGSLGGPLRRDRTFLFVLGQYAPHREGASANGIGTINIPTAAGYAILSRIPFGQGQTPQSRQAVLDAISFLPEIHAQIRRYDQVRDVSINGLPVEFGTTRIAQSRPFDGVKVRGKLDHRLSDRDNFTYIVQEDYYRGPIAFAWPFSNNTFGRRFASAEDDRNQMHSLSHIRILSPTVVNEARVSAIRHIDSVVGRDDSLPRTVVSGLFTLGPANVSPFIRPRNTYEAQDVLTWTRARHSFKFGAHLLFVDDTFAGGKQNIWTFNNFTDLLNNQANMLTLRLSSAVWSILSIRRNYFVQDDWKIRPDLTLNIGLRYQLANLPEGMFGATRPEIAATGVPGPVQPDRNDVAPRFGFAYSPRTDSGWLGRLAGDGSTVLRGGYGIGYGLLYDADPNTPPVSAITSNYPWNTMLTIDRELLINAFPVVPGSLPSGGRFEPLAAFQNYPADAQNPTTHFYSMSLQREFARAWILELGYLGSRSYHLYVATEHNPAILSPEQARQVIAVRNSNVIPGTQQRRLYPQRGARTFREATAYSKYHAGYVKFDRRFSRGLLIGANYTWSAVLGVGETNSTVQNKNDFRSDYARESFDVPHRFVIHYLWETPGRRFYGGWRISGTSQWQSGRPFSLLTGVDSNGDGDADSDRPDYHPGGRIVLDPVTGNWRSFTLSLDGTGIAVTPLGANGQPLQWSVPKGGNLGRNTFRAPVFSHWSVSVVKPFRIAEHARLEFRTDAQNLFNHRNFDAPVNTMNNLNFGRNQSTPPSRVVQLGAKLRF